MKTIKEMICVLDEQIQCQRSSYMERDGVVRDEIAIHVIACLRRAKQIVKASKKCGCAPRK